MAPSSESRHLTDTALLESLGRRIAETRLTRDLTQAELAKEAGVSKRTLIRLEGGESTQLTNLIRVLRALGLTGNLDALVPPPAPSPLKQLQSEEKQRKRASGRSGATGSTPSEGDEAWTWGDDDEDAES